MNFEDFVIRCHSHYLDEFRAFAKRQKALCPRGSPEVKLQLSSNNFFRNLYCADFMKNDGENSIVELARESGSSVPCY